MDHFDDGYYDDCDRAYDLYVEECLQFGLDWRDSRSLQRLRDMDYYNSEIQDEIEESQEVEF